MPRRHVGECYLCGSSDFDAVLSDRDVRFGYPGVYHVVSCRSCGFMFLVDPPASEVMSRWYTEGYGSRDLSDPLKASPNLMSLLRRLVKRTALLQWSKRHAIYWRHMMKDHFDSFVPERGRILDVGCGEGFLMRYLRKRKPSRELVGLEVSKTSAEQARRLGFIVHEASAESFHPHPDLFDSIILSQVIEHLEDPRSYLRKLLNILKPGGMLAISCPNANSYVRTLFGSAWVNWHLPFHLWHFTPETIGHLLDSEGWSVRQLETVTPPIWLFQTLLLWFSHSREASPLTRFFSLWKSAECRNPLSGDCIFVAATRKS